MSTSASPTPIKESTKARSNDPHKTKKRKHADDQEKLGAETKKKHKRSRIENNDGLPAAEMPVKKSKKRARSLPVPIEDLAPTSPSPIDIPNPTPIVIDDDAPETLAADKTTTQPSPSPSILDDTSPSPFHSVRLSLYLPLSAISLSPSTVLASLQAEHLSPLLLSYYAPARGTVLAFTDTLLSSSRPHPSSPPSPTSTSTLILAHCADDYGVSYTWLTTTFLVFRPTRGATLSGWINVCSESFVGLLSYNYFQAGVARSRIPAEWRWVGPGGGNDQDSTQARKRSKRTKVRIRSSESDDDDDDGEWIDRAVDVDMDADNSQATQVAPGDWAEGEYDGTGYFVTADGARVDGTLSYRIVDADVVPGHDRDKWSLQIEGTLLRPEDEAALVEEERVQAEKLNARGKRVTPAVMMSGGLGAEDRRRAVSVSQTPVPSSVGR